MLISMDQLSVTVHSVLNVKESRNWELAPRQNYFAALWYILKGNAEISIRDEMYQVKENDIILLPPNVPFSAKIANESVIPFVRIFVVRFSIYTHNQQDWLRLYELPVLFLNQDISIGKKDILRLLVTKRRESPLMQHFMNGLMQLIAGALIEASWNDIKPIETGTNRKQFTVYRIIYWMERHLEERMTLPQLAALIPVSPDYLNELFHSVTGNSCMQYFTYLRLQRAEKLLQQPGLAVNEISRAVGIEDAHYFSRLFSKNYGLSPTQYRKQMFRL